MHGRHSVVLAAGSTFQKLHRHQKSIQQCGKVLQAVSASYSQCNRMPDSVCCPREQLEHESKLEIESGETDISRDNYVFMNIETTSLETSTLF